MEIRSYRDREHAGRVLALLIGRDYKEGVVMAIPNGGVAVGIEISRRLGFGFALLVVRKLHVPWNRESGFGAITPDGAFCINDELVRELGLKRSDILKITGEELNEIVARVKKYRADLPDITGRTVFLVDDGLASGYTMIAAIQMARKLKAGKIIVAVPTASASAAEKITAVADGLICPNVREGSYFAVADAYENWYDLTDDEVEKRLGNAGFPGGK